MRLIKQYRSDTYKLVGRTLVIVLVVGALVVIGNVSLGVLRTRVAASDGRAHDEALVRNLHMQPGVQVESRIKQQEELLPQLRDKGVIQTQRRQLAALYAELGSKTLKSGDFTKAEQCFQRASEYDPKNSAYMGDMARLYAQAAMQQQDGVNRVQMLRSSSQYYLNAMAQEEDKSRMRSLSDKAADVSLTLAREEMKSPQSRSQGLVDLRKARGLAVPGTETAQHIEDFASSLH